MYSTLFACLAPISMSVDACVMNDWGYTITNRRDLS